MISRYVWIKKALDKLIALILIFILAPIMIFIAIAIKIDSKGPILFRQKRIGKDKAHFIINKFRTMKITTPGNKPTHQLENPEKYLTKIGRFLRKTSLDELPQLINILKGEMSFVGPRPALWNQFDLIVERDKYNVHQLFPGITGWAQISGRDLLEIPEKARLDGEYIKSISFMKDVEIIFKTVIAILKRDGFKEGGTGDKNIENTHHRSK